MTRHLYNTEFHCINTCISVIKNNYSYSGKYYGLLARSIYWTRASQTGRLCVLGRPNTRREKGGGGEVTFLCTQTFSCIRKGKRPSMRTGNTRLLLGNEKHKVKFKE